MPVGGHTGPPVARRLRDSTSNAISDFISESRGKRRLMRESGGAGSGVNILYVRPLPPHSGGTAIVGYQLLEGLARLGHRIRAIAPATSEVLAAGDPFASAHPEIHVSRFLVPYFEKIGRASC